MNNPLSGTSLQLERKKQEKWQLRPHYAGVQIFNDLLNNEFLPAPKLQKRQRQVLQYLLKFCASQVPYYQRLFNKLDINKFDSYELENMQGLPILTKPEVQEYSRDLLAKSLPRGESVGQTVQLGPQRFVLAEVVHRVDDSDAAQPGERKHQQQLGQ